MKTRGLRIVFFSHSAGMYGAERSLLGIVAYLSSLGMECLVILPGKGPLETALAQAGATTARVPLQWWIKARHRSKSFRFLSGVARDAVNLALLPVALYHCLKWRPKVVVTNTVASPLGAVTARLLRRPHVWLIHEIVGDNRHRKATFVFLKGFRFSTWLMSRLSDRLVANSRAVAKWYGPWLESGEPEVVPPWVALSGENRERGPDPSSLWGDGGGLRLLMAGSIGPVKRQEDAVRALGLLRSRGVEARLCLLGDVREPYGNRLATLAREVGVEDRVYFAGYRNDAARCMALADAVLMCRTDEAFGMVTVEAMRAGTAVVGARSAGTAELIDDGVTGLLFEPANPVDLADKLERLARNPELVRTLGKAAEKWSRNRFLEKDSLEPFARLFRELA
ncbi:MAG: glycosyltransferase family 4 protein [Desulfatibacillaceae bacterium]